MKIEVRKSLAIAGLESTTRGCKLPSECTMDNSYTGVQLFCMLASNSLFNIYVCCNEAKFQALEDVIFEEKVYLKALIDGVSQHGNKDYRAHR